MELGFSMCFTGARQGMGWRQRPEQILCALTWTSPYDMYGIRHCPAPITDRRRCGWRKEKGKTTNPAEHQMQAAGIPR
jgi:hypothetical protein